VVKYHSRDVYHTSGGITARKKSERAKDKNGNDMPPVFRKGDVMSGGEYSIKNEYYKHPKFLNTTKEFVTNHFMVLGIKVQSPSYFPTKHVGKGNGKVSELKSMQNIRIEEFNNEYNRLIKQGYFFPVRKSPEWKALYHDVVCGEYNRLLKECEVDTEVEVSEKGIRKDKKKHYRQKSKADWSKLETTTLKYNVFVSQLKNQKGVIPPYFSRTYRQNEPTAHMSYTDSSAAFTTPEVPKYSETPAKIKSVSEPTPTPEQIPVPIPEQDEPLPHTIPSIKKVSEEDEETPEKSLPISEAQVETPVATPNAQVLDMLSEEVDESTDEKPFYWLFDNNESEVQFDNEQPNIDQQYGE
jgi:hypothetical protein